MSHFGLCDKTFFLFFKVFVRRFPVMLSTHLPTHIDSGRQKCCIAFVAFVAGCTHAKCSLPESVIPLTDHIFIRRLSEARGDGYCGSITRTAIGLQDWPPFSKLFMPAFQRSALQRIVVTYHTTRCTQRSDRLFNTSHSVTLRLSSKLPLLLISLRALWLRGVGGTNDVSFACNKNCHSGFICPILWGLEHHMCFVLMLLVPLCTSVFGEVRLDNMCGLQRTWPVHACFVIVKISLICHW